MKFPLPHKMTILIVDDMDDMRRSIRAMLKQTKLGRYFFEASNGKDGWEFLERCKEPIHFIISDLNMPRLSGTELLMKVRTSKKHQDIPFLMVTGEADREVVANAAENEVDAYLCKPFGTDSLEQKIKEMVDKVSNPSDWTKHLLKAKKHEKNGKIRIAINEAKKAVKIRPRSAKPHRELGRLYLIDEDFKKGLECFIKATDLNDLDVFSFNFMGQTYHKLGMMDESINSYSKAMDINPRQTDRAVKFATVLIEEKKLEEAEKILTKAVKTSEHNLDLKEDIIDLCFNNGLNELAAKTCKLVLKEDPDRKYLTSKQGLALLKCGKKKEASRILEKSIDQFSGNVQLMLSLAYAYRDTKEIDKAKDILNQVLEKEPNNTEARQLLENCIGF